MTTFISDKLTDVGYCSSDGPMGDPFLSPPIHGFLQLPPAFAESPASPEVLTSIISTHN
jgi:hypothetical protein